MMRGMSNSFSLRSPLAAYVMPFFVFMGGLVLVSLVKNGDSDSLWLRTPEYWIYPLQTALCGVALVIYWRHYDFGKRGGWGFALAAGVVVLGLWIAPQVLLGAAPRTDGFDPSVFDEGSGLYWLTVLARFARLVVIVPLVEELFWRGFLMRYVIREDFTQVPVGTFQWKSFVLVAVFFMFVHSVADWPAALLCGVIYNLVAVRTGSLAACIAAHALTNLGLGIYIMSTRQWGFW
jgi:hypothetical protein